MGRCGRRGAGRPAAASLTLSQRWPWARVRGCEGEVRALVWKVLCAAGRRAGGGGGGEEGLGQAET